MAANRARNQASLNSDPTPSTSFSSSSISRARRPRMETAGRNVVNAADGGDESELSGVECSRSCCKSCLAGAIADGVAICCCPCAVVDLVAFVLIRVPWMVARRCVKMVRGKRKLKRIVDRGGDDTTPRRRSSGFNRNYLERWRVSEGMIEVTTSFKLDDDVNDDADEMVWLELCRGFGRLSFTGIQSAAKGSYVIS